MHLRTENAFSLLPIRFMVKENHLVRQAFSPYPPARLVTGAHEHFANGGKIYLGDLSVADPSVYPLAEYFGEAESESEPTAGGKFHHHENEGSREKGNHLDQQGRWPYVEFEISDVGVHSELQFNYLIFKPKPATLTMQEQLEATGFMTPARSSWELAPNGDALPISVTPLIARAYQNLNALKLSQHSTKH